MIDFQIPKLQVRIIAILWPFICTKTYTLQKNMDYV